MEKVEFFTKTAYTYERLKQEIMDGTLRQGEKLVVNTISQRYCVSPMPVREALLKLEQEGLVHSSPHRGAWVHKCDYDQFYELMQVSLALETCACRLAAVNRQEETLEQLRGLIRGMESAARSEDISTYQVLNDEFHMGIYRAGNNRELYELIQATQRRTYPYTSIALHASGRMPLSVQEHGDMLLALERKDSTGLATLGREHRLGSYFRFLDFLTACLEDPLSPQNHYYLYGYSDTFAGLSPEEIRTRIQRYRDDIKIM